MAVEDPAKVLARFSLDELLAEIVRRRNEPREEQTAPWCHDCAHFKTWTRPGDPPSTFNPCSKGHRMQFWMPEAWQSPEEYGFYRAVCADRKDIPEGVRDAALPPRPVR